MKNRIVLLTKDAMCKAYLPVYGGKQWSGKTPNIDDMAARGTIFENAYTAAPSTAMAFLGMFTSRFPYELDIHDYTPMKEEFYDNLFKKFENQGYTCHIIWDSKWDILAKPYANCYSNAVFHSLDDLGQPVGARFPHKDPLKTNDKRTEETLTKIVNEVDSIKEEKLFLWIHIPHVINGRISYGGDIDVFDKLVGMLRNRFDDESIYISADHGNMNGTHGSVGYGFSLYQSAVNIPLIVPRVRNMHIYRDNFCMVDIGKLILNGVITERKYVYMDTAYYKQAHRKLSILYKNYKYIYNKQTKTEELYDLEYDNSEGINLINDQYYDVDRKATYPLRDLLSYDRWEELARARDLLRKEKHKIWRQETGGERIYWGARYIAGKTVDKLQHVTKCIRSNLEGGR